MTSNSHGRAASQSIPGIAAILWRVDAGSRAKRASALAATSSMWRTSGCQPPSPFLLVLAQMLPNTLSISACYNPSLTVNSRHIEIKVYKKFEGQTLTSDSAEKPPIHENSG